MKLKAFQAFDFLKVPDMELRIQQIDFAEKEYGLFAGIAKFLNMLPESGWVFIVAIALPVLVGFCFFLYLLSACEGYE